MTIREIELESEDYPARLRVLGDAPKKVWLRGALPSRPAVAIVGTRRASGEALAFTERLALELGRAGVPIVSGGAEGIDAAAHRGALEAGVATVVVHGTSLRDLYPPRNRRLFAQILEAGGAWLSEIPIGAPAFRSRFLERNRLIAALAELVIVVQAPARSGALSTARFARALDRPLLAVPSGPWDPRGEGTLMLLAAGARLCRGASDVLELLGLPGVPIDPPRTEPAPASRDAELVLAALADAPAHVDELVARTGLPAARVSVALVELSIAGRARQDGGVWRAA